MVRGWKKGSPWVCSVQMLLKKETNHGGASLLPYPYFFGKEIGKLVKGGRQG